MVLIYSEDIPVDYLKALRGHYPEAEFISLPKINSVYSCIASHPDIFFFNLDAETLLYAPLLPVGLINTLKDHAINVVPAGKHPEGSYPFTAALNAVRVGDFVFHNTYITDEKIKKEAHNAGLSFIHCNQGYTRCSIVPVKDNGLITQDPGIAKAGRKRGLEVLLVDNANVILPGERYGFIGGATGVLNDGKIIFLGDISRHSSFKEIERFLRAHDVDYLHMPGLPLFDAGSLIFI